MTITEKLDSLDYPYKVNGNMVTITIAGLGYLLTTNQVVKRSIDELKEWVKMAEDQKAIIAAQPVPSIDRKADVE